MNENDKNTLSQTEEALENARKDLIFLDVYVNALRRKMSEKDDRCFYEKDGDYIDARKSAKKVVALTSVVGICVFCIIAVSVYIGINYGRPLGGETAIPFAVGILAGACAGLIAYAVERKKLIKTAQRISEEYKHELAQKHAACTALMETRKSEIQNLEEEMSVLITSVGE